MTDIGFRPDDAVGLVVEEVHGAGLGDIKPSVRMCSSAGGIVRQGIDGAAVNHSKGVFALRADIQPEDGMILLDHDHFDVVIRGKAVLLFFFLEHC